MPKREGSVTHPGQPGEEAHDDDQEGDEDKRNAGGVEPLGGRGLVAVVARAVLVRTPTRVAPVGWGARSLRVVSFRRSSIIIIIIIIIVVVVNITINILGPYHRASYL
jgi:hypothetical protein